MPLFKYVILDRIDILVNQEIRYTQLGAFNDPFEMPIFLEQAVDQREATDRINKIIQEKAHDEYKKLPIKKRLNMLYSVYRKQIENRAVTMKPEIDRRVTGLIDDVTAKTRRTLREADRLFGALSLTETPDNLLMWSHYADQHTGFVIEFDENHCTFNERKSSNDNLRFLQKVVYSDIRPIIKTFSDFLWLEYAFTKSAEWSYEKEWRIAKSVKDVKRTITASPYDICLFDMPATAIKRVILGARVNPTDIDKIKNILGTTPHLRHIRLQQAFLDERRFALNFADC